MKLIKQFFFIFLVILVKFAHAQDGFKLSGVLIEEGTKLRIAMVEVTSVKSRVSVASNDMGLFDIKTAVGDTLLLSKRGFRDLTIVVGDRKDLMLKLNRDVMLDEVLVKGRTRQQSLAEIEKDFKSKGSFYAGKPPLALLSPFGGSPLTFLYELFGKTPKQARRFRKLHQTENEQVHIDHFFNKEIVQEYTALTGKSLDNFMVKYRPDYAQTRTWNTYDGIKWIVSNHEKYKESIK